MALKQNIIYIYFKGKHQVTSKSQYQYNHGQYLYFADLNLPQAFEVHFSNKDKGESKTQIGSDNLVEIPDEYFWNGALQIYAWIYLHSKTTDGETIYEVRIPLTKRAKPTDEEPLPVQQSTIDRAIAELNSAVDITTENANKTDSDKTIVANIKEDVIDLKEEIDFTATTINQKAQETINAAERGETSAQNAAISENKALNYSQQAEQSAQSALESKNIAQQKSEIATNASVEALGYRNETIEAKNQAIQAKQNIVDYRDETKGYRDETLNLKNNVQTLKNQIDETAEEIEDISDSVKEDAQSASLSASSASQSANSASQSANSASQSANSASQSANEAEQYKNQSETNVTHYPKVVDGYWYVWDASNAEYVNTNVDARGAKGDKGDKGDTGAQGIKGDKGDKGDTGATGAQGIQGAKGDTGADGYSPTVTITPITGGHRITITDADGEHSADVMDGDDYTLTAQDKQDIAELVDVPVDDVQINGTSIVSDGVANVPLASESVHGATKYATASEIKSGGGTARSINPYRQHESTFYGLAKAAGDTTQAQSSNAVGTYTEEAKIAIQKMLGINQQGELIADITATEDVTEFKVQTDVNGLPFELSKLIVLFTAGPSTTGTRDSFYTQVSYKNRSGVTVDTSCPSITYPTATSNLIARVTVDAFNDMPIIETEAVGASDGNTIAMNTMIKTVIAKTLTGFKIYRSGSTKSLIPAGSNIKVYGIRA